MRTVSELVEIPELVKAVDAYGLTVRSLPAVVSKDHGQIIAGPVKEWLELGWGVVVLEVEILDELLKIAIGDGLDEGADGNRVVIARSPVRVNVVVEEPVVPGYTGDGLYSAADPALSVNAPLEGIWGLAVDDLVGLAPLPLENLDFETGLLENLGNVLALVKPLILDTGNDLNRNGLAVVCPDTVYLLKFVALGGEGLSRTTHGLVYEFNRIVLVTLGCEAEGLGNGHYPCVGVDLTADLGAEHRRTATLEDLADDVLPVDEPVHSVPYSTKGERVELLGSTGVDETGYRIAREVEVEGPPDTDAPNRVEVLTVGLHDLGYVAVWSSVPVEVILALTNRQNGRLGVEGTVDIDLLPVGVPWDRLAVNGSRVADPLVVGELEDNCHGLRAVAGNVVRTVADEDVLVVVYPLDHSLIASLCEVSGYTRLLRAYAPLLEPRVEGAEPDWDRVAEESLSLGLEVRGLLGADHVKLVTVLGGGAPGELLTVDAVCNGLAEDVVELPWEGGLLHEVSDSRAPLVVGDDVVLVEGVLDVVVGYLVNLETPNELKASLPVVGVGSAVVLVVLAVLVAPLPGHGVVEEVVGEGYRLAVNPGSEAALPGNGALGGLARVGCDPLLLGSIPDYGVVWNLNVVLDVDELAAVVVVLGVRAHGHGRVMEEVPDADGVNISHSAGRWVKNAHEETALGSKLNNFQGISRD